MLSVVSVVLYAVFVFVYEWGVAFVPTRSPTLQKDGCFGRCDRLGLPSPLLIGWLDALGWLAGHYPSSTLALEIHSPLLAPSTCFLGLDFDRLRRSFSRVDRLSRSIRVEVESELVHASSWIVGRRHKRINAILVRWRVSALVDWGFHIKTSST